GRRAPGGLHRGRRRAGRGQGLRRDRATRRCPRARDGRRHAPAPPGARRRAGPARPPTARADLHRRRLRVRLPRAHQRGGRRPAPDPEERGRRSDRRVSRGELSSLQARRIVEARLGREPQDMLEVAVALEAWAGVHAGEALERGRELMATAPTVPRSSAGRLPGIAAQRGVAVEALSFVIAVVAIACWAAPLSDRLGPRAVEQALILALPTTLTLQWGLASRYLSRPGG